MSQKMPGWNNLLMPTSSEESQIVTEVAPLPGEIVVTKTTDRAHRDQPAPGAVEHGFPQSRCDRHLH